MAWRLSARKGKSVVRSSGSRKDVVEKRAKSLRKDGYTVSVYEVKSR